MRTANFILVLIFIVSVVCFPFEEEDNCERFEGEEEELDDIDWEYITFQARSKLSEIKAVVTLI